MQSGGVNTATENPGPKAGVFDWKKPNYAPVWQRRERRLKQIRANPGILGDLFGYYRANPANFINDWGVTFDPRAAAEGKPAIAPFLLFPKQWEWCQWFVDRMEAGEHGVTDKSRDMGISWLAMCLATTLCLFRDNITAGVGSRDEDTVDKAGDPSSLFWKARFFLGNLPGDFRRGWDIREHSRHMWLGFPATKSTITGDAGDNIGRGGRATFYIVDEAAHLKRPMAVEAALSQTTRTRIDVSSVNGMSTPFAQKRWKWNDHRVFTFHWRDDPRKDDAWYAKQVDDLDPLTLAQEVDINYQASTTGILIPNEWVQSAIGADQKLGLTITGENVGALDIADEGKDKNAWAGRRGILLYHVEEWSGKGSDIFDTVGRGFNLCDEHSTRKMKFDSDGLGAGARGDARVLNESRHPDTKINAVAFRGSGAVVRPDKPVPTADNERSLTQIAEARKNKDFFHNRKAQAWWDLRLRFQRTYRCVKAGSLGKYNVDDLIVISPTIPCIGKLSTELSQPTYTITTTGKILVDKQPDGMSSPNLGDSVMIVYSDDDEGYSIEDLRRALA